MSTALLHQKSASPWHSLRDTHGGLSSPGNYRQPNEQIQKLHLSQTAIGRCRLENVGHLVPCDDRHAPIKHYRSYGEWFEAGLRQPKTDNSMMTMSSRYWPYGQDVTKLYQTNNRGHKYDLDDRTVTRARPYVPPNNGTGSLPDLRAYREGGARHTELMDETYHRTFRSSGRPLI
eukprot:TRINITY_DN60574_c0_g1_i1.p1 TRINITY_DN60574_c0_g1~~TRINITY_DN60574_c0_g1_i1.p1  ORF type:complete len:175 (+),score=8.18 TRINITY_DN60574_c0_g1_i1:67-591(+)